MARRAPRLPQVVLSSLSRRCTIVEGDSFVLEARPVLQNDVPVFGRERRLEGGFLPRLNHTDRP
jgi:hypothetical protein